MYDSSGREKHCCRFQDKSLSLIWNLQVTKADFLLNNISFYQHEVIYVIVLAVIKVKEKGMLFVGKEKS